MAMTQADRIQRYADLIQREAGKAVRPYRSDGYVNMMTKYGTSQDASEHYQYVPEPMVPDEVIEQFYEGDGLFAKIIDGPAEEALKHGFTLEDVTDEGIETFYTEALDELDFEDAAMTAIKWARLFGGSIIVMLINDGRGLEEPVDWKNIKSIDGLRVYERAIVEPDYASMYNYDPRDPFDTRGSRLGMPEYYQVFSQYGNFTVHDSRCLVFQNGILPENTSNMEYQFWGIPEYIRINKAVRDAELAHRSAPKMLDRSVQPIYKMKDLSAELSTEEGEDKVLRRLQVIDMARGLLNSLVIDSEGEDYDFKTFSYSGVNDVISASCSMLSAVTNIPQVVLFGQQISGMSSTDDTTMENYYNYIERIQKRMLKTNIRYLLSVIFQAGVATGEVDEVPKLKVQFNPLWSLSDLDKADLDQKRAAVEQTRAQTAQAYVDMQVLDPSEIRKKLADSDEFDIETLLDEYDDEDLFANMPQGEEEQGEVEVPQEGTMAPGAEGLSPEASVEEHDNETEESGNAPMAAPDATLTPQDMSEEGQEEVKENAEEEDSKDMYTALKAPTKANQDLANTPHTPEVKNGSVGVIVVKNGEILCGTRMEGEDRGMICGPGGCIEEGETPEEAAIREMVEEFGIGPKEILSLGEGAVEEDGNAPYLFLCTDYVGEPDCNAGELFGARFMSLPRLRKQSSILFEPFANGLDVMEDCLYREDCGHGSGNFGHAGNPGHVGGSLPTARSLNQCVKEAQAKGKKATEAAVKDAISSMPVGTKFTNSWNNGASECKDTFVKVDEDKIERTRELTSLSGKNKGEMKTFEDTLTADRASTLVSPISSFEVEEINSCDVAEKMVENGELDPKETSVPTPAGVTSINGLADLDEEGKAEYLDKLKEEHPNYQMEGNGSITNVMANELCSTPEVLSPEEFDKYCADHDATKMYRGISDLVDEDNNEELIMSSDEIASQFASSKTADMGGGNYGYGWHFFVEGKDDTRSAKERAVGFADHGNGTIIECAISPTANFVTESEVENALKDKTIADTYEYDKNAWALAHGYDGTMSDNGDVVSVANRGALIMKATGTNSDSREDGGPGSGNWGHKGVAGQHGGSAPSDGTAGYATRGDYEKAKERAQKTLAHRTDAINRKYDGKKQAVKDQHGNRMARSFDIREDSTLTDAEKEKKLSDLNKEFTQVGEELCQLNDQRDKDLDKADSNCRAVFAPDYEYDKIDHDVDIVSECNQGIINPTASVDNCQRCAMAYELRERGYDVQASEGGKDALASQYNISRCFVDADTASYAVQSSYEASGNDELTRNVQDKMLSWGDGARAVVTTQCDGWAHTFNLCNKNNEIYMVDTQSGAIWSDKTSKESGGRVNLGLDDARYVTVMRTDNAIPAIGISDYVTRR